MITILYVLIVLIATISGAVAGLGGGVIIKPLFDALGYHDASTIGVYSCLAVFTMCIVSILKQMKHGFSFDIKTGLFISLGSMAGGLLGDSLFGMVTSSLEDNMVKVIQASLLGFTLVLILIYTIYKEKVTHYQIKNVIMTCLVGLFLGAISVFLGIGGGPMNVALLMLLFSYSMKEATVYSIVTIFFSQLSKIGTMLLGGSLFTYDLGVVPFICVAAIIGGFLGTTLNQTLSDRSIERFYIFLLIVLMVISGYNIVTNL